MYQNTLKTEYIILSEYFILWDRYRNNHMEENVFKDTKKSCETLQSFL